MQEPKELKELVQVLTDMTQGKLFAWGTISGSADILRRALHNTVRLASQEPTSFIHLDKELERCCTLLAHPKAQTVVEQCAEVPPTEAMHLLGNAQALVATAGAAVAACCGRSNNNAPERFIFWATLAINSLTPKMLKQHADNASEINLADFRRVQPGKCVVNYACVELARHGWPITATRCWIHYWLDGKSTKATVVRRLNVPVGSYHDASKCAFLMDLRLSLLNAAQGYLIEHPDIALLPMDEDFRSALQHSWEYGGRQAVCWSLTMRDLEFGSLPSLQDSSMGAAAATGFRLLHDNKGYKNDCIILACCKDHNAGKYPLSCVANEWEKLKAVTDWNNNSKRNHIRRAVVAKDSKLTESDCQTFLTQGLEVVTRETIDEALDVVRRAWAGFRPVVIQPAVSIPLIAVSVPLALGLVVWYNDGAIHVTKTNEIKEKVQQIPLVPPQGATLNSNEFAFDTADWQSGKDQLPPLVEHYPQFPVEHYYLLNKSIDVPPEFAGLHIHIQCESNARILLACVNDPDDVRLTGNRDQWRWEWVWEPSDNGKSLKRRLTVQIALWIGTRRGDSTPPRFQAVYQFASVSKEK